MPGEINILIVEDSPNDAEMLIAELRRAGFNPTWKRIETESDFLAEIKNSPDIILSDYSMPEFSGLRAAELLHASGLEIPFILVSGKVGEEVAVDAMRHGATDYLLKDRIARLGSAVERALGEMKEHRELKRAEEQISLQTRALEAAGNAIVITDRKGEILWANPAFGALTGYALDEVLGQNPRLLKSGEHGSDFYKQLWQTIGADQIWQGEITNRRKDGSLYQEEMTIAPVRAAGGEITHFIAVKQDITERKKTETGRDRLAAILEATPDLVGFSDPVGRILYFNRAGRTLLGLGLHEDVTSSSIADIIPDPASNPILTEGVPAAIRDGMWSGETLLLSRSGQKIPVSQVILAHKSPAGKLEFLSTIMRDISERKRAEDELRKTQKELLKASRQAGMAEFATDILHNVGNVLNSVNVATACLSNSLKKSKSTSLAKVVVLMRQHEADLGAFFTCDPKGKQVPGFLARLADKLADEQTSALAEIGELQKGLEHVKNVITVQQDSAKMSGLTEELQVTALVEDALKMTANGLARAEIQVSKEYKEVPPITTERNKVLQILVNLVRNAVQSCEASSSHQKRLTIRVRQEADSVRIEVADNGSGISGENLPRIFAHGFTTKKDGHGFGLHSAEQAAKEMGGSLTVHSEGTGRGATFTLELPVHS